jgi:anaerobic magnesium-protoporphyrin IX monomethyl ester cyclase
MRFLLLHVSKNWQGRVYAEYPIGPGLIATIARKLGHWAHVHDMAVDESSIEQILQKYRPDVVGLSFLSTSSRSAYRVIKSLRVNFRGPVVAGGIHPSLFPEEVLAAGADVVVIGEGEEKVGPLLEALRLDTKAQQTALSALPGLAIRTLDGDFFRTKPDLSSVNLEHLPIVDRTVFDLSRYAHHSLITSRGCPYRCKFCCSWGPGGRKGRMASPTRVLRELEHLVSVHNAETVYWADDMFFFNKRDRLSFCNELRQSGLNIRWIAQLRADNIDLELAEAMLGAGCIKVCLGTEAGAEVLLQSIDKDITVPKIRQGIETAVSAGLRVKTWWIVGLPGSNNPLDHLAAIDLIEETRPHEVAIHNFIPLPGTQYWTHAKEFGIHLPGPEILEDTYYYGLSDALKFDYLSKDQIETILYQYDMRLADMGYIPTDRAPADSRYVYTTPLQKTTFRV